MMDLDEQPTGILPEPLDAESMAEAIRSVQEKHAETLSRLRDTINQLRQTIADAIKLRDAKDDAGCETRVLQVKLLYGRVQGLEQELEQIVGGSDLLVKYVRDSADEKDAKLQTEALTRTLIAAEAVKCRQQKGAVDKIDVPAEAVFLDQAPASLKPPDVLQDPHKMMLNRLAWEFSQRIALRADLDREEKAKKSLGTQAAKAKDELEKIQEQLTPIFMSAAPIREALPGAIDHLLPENPTDPILPVGSEHLSSPLYAVYLSAFCHAAVFDKQLQVSVVGQPAPAPEEKCQSALDLFEPHPMSVRLTLSDVGYSMVFQYIPRMDIVCVKGEPHSRFLRVVLEGDTGEDSPNPANEYQIDAFDNKLSFGDTLAATSLGQPYRWAQHLAGLDFLPSRKSDFGLYVRSRLSLGTILDSIRAKAPAKR